MSKFVHFQKLIKRNWMFTPNIINVLLENMHYFKIYSEWSYQIPVTELNRPSNLSQMKCFPCNYSILV